VTIVVAILFKLVRWGRCPCCHSWTSFSRPQPALYGPIPVEVQGLVPQVCKCRRNGCTSSERAIVSLELRPASVEA
jgi:hypothetical protein